MDLKYFKSTIVLMFEDIPVLLFNFSKGLYSIINELYVPYGIKGKLIDNTNLSEREIEIRNSNVVTMWLARRVLTLSRSNANKIYDLFDFDRFDDEYTRLDIALVCRAVSVLDKYWVKIEGEHISWRDVDIRSNPLNEIVANVALHGDSLTLQGSYSTPELTTNGLFTKAWRRHSDGTLWLYKCGSTGDVESEIEVEVSRVLDKCNVKHVNYKEGRDRGKYVCMCKCMTNDRYSTLPASEFRSYCKTNNLDFESEVLKIDKENYYKMHIVDYLISNNDRHSNNWGFYLDNENMNIVSLHPLFDHNSAFYSDWVSNKNLVYRCTNRPMREDAIKAVSEVDFHFTNPIVRDDFDWDEHYESFMDRASDLGIRTVKGDSNKLTNAVTIMSGD